MKVPTKYTEPSGIKLGIVRLGPAVGKLKYTMLDKRDLDLIHDMWFEPYVEVDKDGNGVHVYAFVYDSVKGRAFGRFVHELLWEKHNGGIAPGFKVAHRNGITVDNRLENLVLCPEKCCSMYNTNEVEKESLYWAAIEEMPHEVLPLGVKLFSVNEEIFRTDEERYFECHYLPCTRIEQYPQEFSICGRCQVARYCGPICQAKDWPWHKPECRQCPRLLYQERFPER